MAATATAPAGNLLRPDSGWADADERTAAFEAATAEPAAKPLVSLRLRQLAQQHRRALVLGAATVAMAVLAMLMKSPAAGGDPLVAAVEPARAERVATAATSTNPNTAMNQNTAVNPNAVVNANTDANPGEDASAKTAEAPVDEGLLLHAIDAYEQGQRAQARHDFEALAARADVAPAAQLMVRILASSAARDEAAK